MKALEAALARFQAGDREGAAARLAAALAKDPRGAAELVSRAARALRAAARRGPAEALQAARALRDLGRTREALLACRRAEGAEARALRAQLEADRGRLEAAQGRPRRALASLEAALSARPLDPGLLLEAAALHERLGDPLSALRLVRRAGKRPELLERRAQLEASLGLRAAALKTLARARGPSAALRRAELRAAGGDYEGARAELRGLAEPEALRAAARLELWAGRAAAAAGLARRAGDEGLLGAALALDGRLKEARPLLDRAVRARPEDADALIWRGEVLRRLGRRAAAQRDLRRACLLAVNPLGAALNLRLMDPEEPLAEAMTEQAERFAALARRRGSPAARRLPPGPPRGPALEVLLAELGGNRSRTPTLAARGRLVAFRYESGKEPLLALQARVRFGDWRGALRALAGISRRRPRDGQALTHRAELLLWLGRYAEARRLFLRARRVSPTLRWVKFGLCACALLEGDLASARRHVESAVQDKGLPFSQWVWNGEVLRRLGRHAEAAAEFRKAVRLYPFRVSAWVNLALAEGARGRRAEARRLFERLRRGAYSLVYDAAAAEGLDLEELDRPLSEREVERVLERALALMRGNRSSWLPTYVPPGGELRPVGWTGTPA